MKRIALLAALVFSSAHAETLYEYGQQCAKEIAEIPAFSCMAGELIPITVNGAVPPAYTPNMSCDKPSLLPATEAGAQGQCLPGTRALLLRDDKTAQVSAICRKKVVRAIESPLFDEINIVSHSLKSGKTCWFTAKAAEPLTAAKGIDGRLVPSPTARNARQGYALVQAASEAKAQQGGVEHHKLLPPDQVWLSPQAVANSKPACVHCHDSGPFMYSPYIAQTTQLPGDPFGRYAPKAVGKDFQKAWWNLNAHGITTRGNTCTACHRVGNMNSCNVAMWQASGRAPQPGADDWAKEFPQSHWMSPGNLHSRLQWDASFADSLRQLAACCQDPKGPGCQVQP